MPCRRTGAMVRAPCAAAVGASTRNALNAAQHGGGGASLGRFLRAMGATRTLGDPIRLSRKCSAAAFSQHVRRVQSCIPPSAPRTLNLDPRCKRRTVKLPIKDSNFDRELRDGFTRELKPRRLVKARRHSRSDQLHTACAGEPPYARAIEDLRETRHVLDQRRDAAALPAQTNAAEARSTEAHGPECRDGIRKGS